MSSSDVYAFKLPDIGEGIHEGEIVQWLVQPGDVILEDQPLVEVMTDKVTAEIPSPVSGTSARLHAEAGQVVEVGSVIVTLSLAVSTSPTGATSSTESPASEKQHPIAAVAGLNAQTVAQPPAQTPIAVLAAPATRKQARALGLDLTQLVGSGPHGRITPQDLVQARPSPTTTHPLTTASPGNGASSSAVGNRIAPQAHRPDTWQPFRGIRRTIADHLAHAKRTAPHFAYVEEIDMSGVVALRNQLKPLAEAQQIKLTFLPFIIKAVLLGLDAYPILNSMLDETSQEIVLKSARNIGIATDTDQGLIVPVIHNAHALSLMGLAKRIGDISQKGRTGQLTPAEISGGTFTLTSIGSLGGVFGIPIINVPEVAIVGINEIEPRPVVRDGQIVTRDMMHLSLSCDHRVVDGADGAQFMNVVKAALENPGQLIAQELGL